MSSPVISDASKALSTRIQIFLKIKKKIHIHAKCIQTIFTCPHENDGNMLMIYLWCMTLSYSKTSIFIRPQANKKLMFSKILTRLESIFEKTCFRWSFSPDTYTCGQWAKPEKKYCLFLNKNGYMWTSPNY